MPLSLSRLSLTSGLLLMASVLAACGPKAEPVAAASTESAPAEAAASNPAQDYGFDVKVTFSPTSVEALKASGEAVTLRVGFVAPNPNAGSQPPISDVLGPIDDSVLAIFEEQFGLTPGDQVVKVTGARVAENLASNQVTVEPGVEIEVLADSRTAGVLSCTVYEAPASSAREKSPEIDCRLSSEASTGASEG